MTRLENAFQAVLAQFSIAKNNAVKIETVNALDRAQEFLEEASEILRQSKEMAREIWGHEILERPKHHK